MAVVAVAVPTPLYTHCAHVCMPLDVHPRACTGPFRCVRPVYMSVRLWTCIHVPVQALFGVCFLFTCVYASGPASRCLYRPLSLCTPCLCECTPLDVHPRTDASPFPCVLPVYVCVCLWTCIHARLYRPFSVCTPCARVCMPLDVNPRACTGPFRCVRPVHVCVRLYTFIHVLVLALFGVYTL